MKAFLISFTAEGVNVIRIKETTSQNCIPTRDHFKIEHSERTRGKTCVRVTAKHKDLRRPMTMLSKVQFPFHGRVNI